MKDKPIVWACGGGTQSVAIAVLIAEGALPKPDLSIMADTSREATETWEYKRDHLDPLLAKAGVEITIGPHSVASADLWNGTGELLVPAFTETGKLTNFCSRWWKGDVNERMVRLHGINGPYTLWLGFSMDERERCSKNHRGYITNEFPLIDLRMTRQACYRIIEAAGLPRPPKSSCFICPHRSDDQWIKLRDQYPADWEAACHVDELIREVDQANGASGVWLHKSRVPLRMATLVPEDERQPLFAERPCNSGYCFV